MSEPVQLPAIAPLLANADSASTGFALAAALGLVALALAAWMIVRARKPALPPLQPKPPLLDRLRLSATATRFDRWNDLVGRVLTALRYLSTRREWRYQVPWAMLIGERGAGKTSLAASLGSGRRQGLLLREQRQAIAGTAWRFFDGGVLIDPAGALPAAAEGSDEAKDWRGVLSALASHRPERPLDALVLTVSARTLLEADAPTRTALAEQCYEQLFALQKRFEFAYPVYVVVTQCDAIDGFDAFWAAQPPERLKEMWGWSNPSFQDGDTAPRCAAAAWKSMGKDLRQLQVEAAATGAAIADGDRFFLFPRRFAQLEAPLARFLDVALRPSAYHASYFLRGIYCAGSPAASGALREEPRGDVAFVDALFERKVFAETLLARPTRQSVWSRNLLLRRLQFGAVGFFALLFLGLAATAAHLGKQATALTDALETLKQLDVRTSEGCIDKGTVYDLLGDIGHIDPDLRYPTIPLSWIRSGVMETSIEVISERAFNKVIMPSFACHLERKSRALLADPPAPAADGRAAAETVMQARERLTGYLAEVRQFEEQLHAFDVLAARAAVEDAETQIKMLEGLAAYVYGEAPPAMAGGDRNAFAQAVARIEYAAKPQLPPAIEEKLAKQVDARAAALAKEIDRQVGQGEELVGQMARSDTDALASARRVGWWVEWVRKEWLASDEKSNPCRRTAEGMAADISRLRGEFHFPASLEEAARRFSPSACYQPAMRKLAATRLPRYGAVFVKTGGALEVAPAVASELRGLAALTAEDFMQVPATEPFACRPGAVGWRLPAIEEADRYIRAYQMFARVQGADAEEAANGTRPLYDGLARRHLRALLDQTLGQGQIAAPAPRTPSSATEPLSQADQELARRSDDFAKAVDPLLQTLRLYRQIGFDAGADHIAQCARDFAAGMLLKVDALAETSRLYEPPSGSPPEGSAGPVYAVGNGAVAKDYLARQLQRAQVLGGYAAPFVAFLKNSDAVDDSKRANGESLAYWDNSLSEMRRYVQFKEPNGQVAFLENFVVKQLADMSYDNCRKLLVAYKPETAANDFFAARRRHLERDAKARCDNRSEADAYAQYRDLATRFNRELAGRYPFAEADAPDGAPDAVRAFFADYDARREALGTALADLDGKRWQGVHAFVEQLDGAAAFFRAGLTAPDGPKPMRLDIGFRALPKQSPGTEQIVYWRLVSGPRAAVHPNGAASLEWPVGEVLALELQWAEQSAFRPVGDPSQRDLVVEGRSASFVALGDWALLRLLDAHRPRAVAAGAGTDGTRKRMAEFVVPVSTQKTGPAPGPRSDVARAYLTLAVSGVDAKSQAATVVKVPAFPQRAPVFW